MFRVLIRTLVVVLALCAPVSAQTWTTLASDTFTAADTTAINGRTLNNSLGGSETDTWTAITGTGWLIFSNKGGVGTTDATYGSVAVVGDTADQAVQRVTVNISSGSHGVGARWSSGTGGGTFYLCYATDTVGVRAFKVNGASFTQLGSTGSAGLSFASAHDLQIVTNGTSIVCNLDGSPSVSTTDGAYSTGKPIIYDDVSSSVALDNFKYEADVSGGVASTASRLTLLGVQ